MINASILSWTAFIYLAALLFYALRMLRQVDAWGRWATGAALLGLAVHTVGLGVRWVESYQLGIGHAPLSNFYESLIFFAWAIVLVYLLAEWRLANRSLGIFVMPAAFFMMGFASLSPDEQTRIQPLIPALQSNWLTSHVVTCFLGYAFFALAFGLGVMYFTRGRAADGRAARFFPTGEVIDGLIYTTSSLGFVFLTLGIVTGAVWAHVAWGRYWSWDPKETWSLITWCVYAIMLHARFVFGWRGRRMAVLAVVGFAAAIFTYLGVNFLPSLHSYF
jgi:cytochrome c-type biogenesis protein CcsB